MKKILFFVILVLLFVCILISIFNITSWYKWYIRKKTTFVVDIDFFILTEKDIQKIIYEFNKAGINLFAIDVGNFLSIKDKTFFNNCKFVLKIFSQKIYNVNETLDAIDKNKDKIFSIIYLRSDKYAFLLQQNFYGRKIALDEVCEFLKKNLLSSQNKLFKLNFEQQDFAVKIGFAHLNFIPLRTFLCDFNQVEVNKTSVLFLKIKKAVFERSCSIVYIIPSEYQELTKNIEIVKKLVNEFGNNKNFSFEKYSSLCIDKVFNFIVVVFSIFFPLFLYKKILNVVLQSSVDKVYFFINLLTILFGIIIWGFLQKYEYVAKESFVYGTKLMFSAPIILSFFVVLNKEEKIFLFNYKVSLKEILVVFLILIIFLYLLIRMGNVSKKYVLKFELGLRELIERYILFRPRFKEIFFAQPLFVISLWLLKKFKQSLVSKLLFCLSITSLVSIINTFLHIHTPVWICVLRSIVGVILGWFIGKICLIFMS